MLKNTLMLLAMAMITVPILSGCNGKDMKTAKTDEHAGHASETGDNTETGEIKPVKVGKYQIELWPPEDGLYAGEEIDVEFAVFDSTKKDPEMGGMLGVADVKAEAVVTMPSMAGMPEQKPNIHQEGTVGVQGLELYFPHGGEYQIDLTLTPKGDNPMKAAFKVDVADEKPTATAKKPFELKVVDFPADAKPGQPVDLKLQVLDTKTDKPVTKFDVAHEQRFHLLIASKDLSKFQHEHPEMQPDGTWIYKATFPTGGDYWIYGDVAPTGKGSRILISKVSLFGEGPNEKIAANLGPSKDGGLVGRLVPGEIAIGKMSSLEVQLTDEKTGKPAGDTEPWLGAAGHLMIIHEDGQTVVHSHPHEDEHSAELVKQGKITFNARFPKAGMYKAYAQVKRGGELKTLGFGLEVK